MSLKTGDIVIKNVITLEKKAAARDAVIIMDKHEIGCLVVIQDENPVGIITERDMQRGCCLNQKTQQSQKSFKPCQPLFVYGNPQMDIQDATKLMIDKKTFYNGKRTCSKNDNFCRYYPFNRILKTHLLQDAQ